MRCFQKKTVLWMVALSLFILLYLGGCGKEKAPKEYSFPLTEEAVTEALKESGLSWTVEQKAKGNFVFRDEGPPIAAMDSELNMGKFLRISGHSPFWAPDVSSVYEEDWAKTFHFCCILFGQGSDYLTLHQEFMAGVEEKNKEAILSRFIRLGESHVLITLFPEVHGKRALFSAVFMDEPRFKESFKKLQKDWTKNLKQNAIKDLGHLKIADLLASKEEACYGASVSGTLKDMSALSQKEIDALLPTPPDLPQEVQENENLVKKAIFSRDEFFEKGVLSDETGTLTVYCRHFSLNEEEQKEERIHYLYYFPKEQVGIVIFSIK